MRGFAVFLSTLALTACLHDDSSSLNMSGSIDAALMLAAVDHQESETLVVHERSDNTLLSHPGKSRQEFAAEVLVRMGVTRSTEELESIAASFAENNAEVTIYDSAFFGNRSDISILTEAEETALTEKGDFWMAFDKTYAASGFFAFSRPGISADGEAALIFVANYCGTLCGSGRFVFLRWSEADRAWMVETEHSVWVS